MIPSVGSTGCSQSFSFNFSEDENPELVGSRVVAYADERGVVPSKEERDGKDPASVSPLTSPQKGLSNSST